MTTSIIPSSRRTPNAPRIVEVSGQCKSCLDLFGVDVYLEHGTLYAVQTNHLGFMNQELIHKPGKCNGKVKLYGSTENLVERTSNNLARYARYQHYTSTSAHNRVSEAV